jgi:predicted secreted protein
MKYVGVSLLLCLVLPVLTCHAADGGAPAKVLVNDSGTWYRADKVLTEHDFGRTIKATPGTLIDITVAENMTTGYSWHYSWAPLNQLTLVRTTSVGPQIQMPGAGSTRHYLLLVKYAQKCKFNLQYGRWWQGGDRDPVKTITIDATAKASQ